MVHSVASDLNPVAAAYSEGYHVEWPSWFFSEILRTEFDGLGIGTLRRHVSKTDFARFYPQRELSRKSFLDHDLPVGADG